MSRKWTPANKHAVLHAYVRQVHSLGKNLRLAGLDFLPERAECLNKAQSVAFPADTSMHRRFTSSMVPIFLKANYGVLEKLRDEFLEKRLEEGQALEPAPIQSPFSTPVPTIKAPMGFPPKAEAKEIRFYPDKPTIVIDSRKPEKADDILPEDKRHPLFKKLNETISLIEDMKSMANQLIATSQLNVQAIDKALHTGVSSPRLDIVTPTPIKERTMGQARAVFSQKPKVIVCGFSRHLTVRLHDDMPRYELHTRHTDAALLQCIAEHPDSTVLIISDKYKFGEKLKYVTDAFGITVIRIPDKRETLLQAVAEINNYQF